MMKRQRPNSCQLGTNPEIFIFRVITVGKESTVRELKEMNSTLFWYFLVKLPFDDEKPTHLPIFESASVVFNLLPSQQGKLSKIYLTTSFNGSESLRTSRGWASNLLAQKRAPGSRCRQLPRFYGCGRAASKLLLFLKVDGFCFSLRCGYDIL